MNTILVATDFSSASDKAIDYAAQLAKKISASVRLLHVYNLPVPTTDYPFMMVSAADLKKASDEGLRRTKENARQRTGENFFETESRLGDVVAEIMEACKELNPFAVVVGTTDEKDALEELFLGDTVLALMENCSYPVISVSETATIKLPENIVLATDILNPEEMPVTDVAAIANVLGAKLHVVHVEDKKGTTVTDALMNAFGATPAVYHPIADEDVVDGIKQYVLQNNIELAVILPHKHNLYERLFHKSHAKQLLHSLPVPVMSLRNE